MFQTVSGSSCRPIFWASPIAVLAGLIVGTNGAPAQEPDAELKRLMRMVANPDENAQNRINAAKKIGELGEEKGKAGTRALCQMATTVGAVRRPALDAIEKVHPKLYPHVVTLLVDNESAFHYKAVAEIAKLGEDGSAATPVIMAHTRHMLKLAGDKVAPYNNLLLSNSTSETMAIPLLAQLARIDKDDLIREAFIRHGRSFRNDTFYISEKAAILAIADSIALARVAGDEQDAVKLIANSVMINKNNLVRYGAIVAIKLFDPQTALVVQKHVKKIKTDPDKAVREEAVEVDKVLDEAAKKKDKK